MKALFTAVRQDDQAAVLALLDKSPDLINAIAKSPPKKDDGQSPLQVAIKAGHFAMANLLIDRGADINFVDASKANSWNMPVVHDALRAATFSTRFGRNRALPGEPPEIEVMSTLERFEAAFGVLDRIVAMGADVNATDSHGNPALARAVLDARQVIDDPLLPELADDLGRIFDLLKRAGADLAYVDQRVGETLIASFADEPVSAFLRG